jgi:hypothetical protein
MHNVLLFFDSNGKFLRSVQGAFIGQLSGDRFLVNTSRASYIHEFGSDPFFYSGETLALVNRAGTTIATTNVTSVSGRLGWIDSHTIAWEGGVSATAYGGRTVIFRPSGIEEFPKNPIQLCK